MVWKLVYEYAQFPVVPYSPFAFRFPFVSWSHRNLALSTAKQQDRNNILSVERKLKTERDARLLAESQLREERKKQKTEDTASKYREEASLHEACIALKAELEDEIRQLRAMCQEKEEDLKRAEKEAEALRKKSKENENAQFKKEAELLMSALAAMQGKNTHLENSLSSETRLKLDLFSALGETRRQLEITQNKLTSSEREREALKAKVAEAMAVMPTAGYSSEPSVPCFPANHVSAAHDVNLHGRSLDPSAPCYVPAHKNGLLWSNAQIRTASRVNLCKSKLLDTFPVGRSCLLGYSKESVGWGTSLPLWLKNAYFCGASLCRLLIPSSHESYVTNSTLVSTRCAKNAAS